MLSFNYFLLHTPKILAGIVCFCPINMNFIHEQFILIFFENFRTGKTFVQHQARM